jgi:hypothetical protein
MSPHFCVFVAPDTRTADDGTHEIVNGRIGDKNKFQEVNGQKNKRRIVPGTTARLCNGEPVKINENEPLEISRAPLVPPTI